MDRQTSYTLGILLVSASAFFWSTAGIFPRIIEADTPTMLLWRGVFGALFMFGFMLFQTGKGIGGRFLAIDRHTVIYGAIGAAAMQMFIASFRYTSVAHGAVIYAVVPFLAGGLGWIFLSERPSKMAVASSLIALIGVIIMMGLGGGEGHISGDLLAFGATFAMACLMILGRKFVGIDLLMGSCLSTLISAMVSLPFSGEVPTGQDMLLLVAFGMFNQAAGFVCFAYGSRLLAPTETALIGALDAPLAPFWAWLLFSVVPLPATLLGGGIVFFAVMAHFSYQARQTGASNLDRLSP